MDLAFSAYAGRTRLRKEGAASAPVGAGNPATRGRAKLVVFQSARQARTLRPLTAVGGQGTLVSLLHVPGLPAPLPAHWQHRGFAPHAPAPAGAGGGRRAAPPSPRAWAPQEAPACTAYAPLRGTPRASPCALVDVRYRARFCMHRPVHIWCIYIDARSALRDEGASSIQAHTAIELRMLPVSFRWDAVRNVTAVCWGGSRQLFARGCATCESLCGPRAQRRCR